MTSATAGKVAWADLPGLRNRESARGLSPSSSLVWALASLHQGGSSGKEGFTAVGESSVSSPGGHLRYMECGHCRAIG